MPLTVLSVGYPLATISQGTAGGAEQVLLTLDKALVESGHRSLVVAPAGSRCHGLLLPVHTPTSNFDENSKRQAQQRFKQSLDRVLDHFKVDLLHMHGLDFDQYVPQKPIPIVVSLHLPLAWYRQEALRRLPPHIQLIAVSPAQARTAPRDLTIASIIPNGIELDRFQGTRQKGDYVLVLGRICPEKGIHLAIDAAERARVPLIVAGTVFDYPEHQRYFREMVLPRLTASVRFISAVGGKRKAHLLAGARCLLVPSTAPETSCLVAMEALAAGTPVIAWRSGALPDIVRHECTGFLVSSVPEMAEAILRVGSIHPDSCRSEAERRFSSQRMISRYMALYQELLPTRAALEYQAA